MDDLEDRLRSLSGGLPLPRTSLSEAEKDELVARVGPRTAAQVVRALKDFPRARIPFLFSTLNTQDVVDLMANDVHAAIARAIGVRPKTKQISSKD